MGTAFLITPPPPPGLTTDYGSGGSVPSNSSTTEAVLQKVPTRYFFLTAKHTFAPWDHTKDAASMKIPEEFRKQRYVIARLYNTDPQHQRALRDSYVHATLVASHPTLDVSLLSVSRQASFACSPASSSVGGVPQQKTETASTNTTSKTPGSSDTGFSGPVSCADVFREALTLSPHISQQRAEGNTATFFGFRGEGRLGQLDTFDASLLQKLPPQERDALLQDLKDVEGKQVSSQCTVQILSHLGAAAAAKPGEECYHGMSGCPLICPQNECGGILYGKHPDYPQHIGYIPTEDFYAWVQKVITNLSA